MAFKKRKVAIPRTLGRRLKEARLRKDITLEEAESVTKIRLKYLEALERDNLRNLPAVYAQGFVARYADFLGISRKEAIEQFKSEGGRAYSFPVNKLAPEGNVKELKFAFTPQTIIVILVILGVLALLGYIGIQVKKFSAPPPLEIQNAEEAVTSPQFLFKGKTLSFARLTINGELVNLDDQGNFSELITLQPGLNSLEVIAQNRAGRQTKRVIKVLYNPPPAEVSPPLNSSQPSSPETVPSTPAPSSNQEPAGQT